MSRAAPPAWNDERALPIGDVSGNGDIVRRFAFSPNGRYLACGWECAHIVRVWDASTAEVVYDIPLPKNTEAGGVAWAPNGTRVAVTTRSYFKKPVHQVIIADFTPDGGRSHRTVFTCKNGVCCSVMTYLSLTMCSVASRVCVPSVRRHIGGGCRQQEGRLVLLAQSISRRRLRPHQGRATI